MAYPFRTLGVVGAGNMGSGIAQKMATEGFAVVLVDVDDARVTAGLKAIAGSLAEAAERRVLAPAQVEDALTRVHGTTRFEDLSPADLVVEAVFESLDVKRDVFRRLEQLCRPETILATNTSSFSVSEIAAEMADPDRVLGLHYFFHPAKNRLVEVVPGTRTAADVTRRAWALQELLGKTPIASRDASGFVVNRYFVPWLVEAVRLLQDGLGSPAEIDAVARTTFGIGMGPFELMNVTGIPIALHAATTLGAAFGPMYAPPSMLAEQVATGRSWPLGDPAATGNSPAIADRLRAVTFLVACSLVEEGVGSMEDTDVGARVGLRWRRGPFEMMNELGVGHAAALVEPYAGSWHTPAPRMLVERSGRPFELAAVRAAFDEGVATLTINRPDTMNALNETVVRQLRAALDRAAARADVHGIVLAGAGKAFVAGADIKFFIDRIEARELDRIVAFTREGQALLRAIETCPKPVVARVHGLALGGGLELALACHRVVASTRATMGFPETGIGIYPGLGGTQRTTRRVGRGLARWLVFTGQMVTADEAAAIGLVDRAVPPGRLDAAVSEALLGASTGGRGQQPRGDEHALLADFFERHDVATLRGGKADTGGDQRLEKAMRRTTTKAPVALRIAGALIDEGASLPLPDALELELGRLTEVFSTRDAYAGLRSVGGKPPVFEGR
jgi:enoyl-CoA hydratase/3-hydroxyacyl-CoA dehydrogenase